MKYRTELDGLRAVAVIAVILFHLNADWLPGGFLGVDVFFVISGYLITTLIQKKIDAECFSLKTFWLRRFRRLYPVFCVVISITAVVASMILIQPERSGFVRQSLAAIFSYQNIFLWRTTGGYWDTSAENMVLLHTWSLSLEEQFYLIFPLLLILLNKFFNRKYLVLAISVMAVCSLLLCVVVTPLYAKASFYLLPTRMWELLIGSILALVRIKQGVTGPKNTVSEACSLLGILLVITSFIFTENTGDFPGYKPLFPCIGTALILYGGDVSRRVKFLLDIRVLRYVGNISYSLYLWHWPVIVLNKFVSLNDNILIVLLLTTGLSVASYHLIENPFRRGFRGSSRLLLILPIIAFSSLALFHIFKSSPTLPDQLLGFDSPATFTRSWNFESKQALLQGESGIQLGDLSKTADIVLVGSSHARVLASALENYIERQGASAWVMATSGIGIAQKEATVDRPKSILVDVARLRSICEVSPSITILAGKWNSELATHSSVEGFKDNLRQIAAVSGRVFVLSQVPMADLPRGYEHSLRKFILAANGSDRKPMPSDDVVTANQLVMRLVDELNLDNLIFIDITNVFIKEDGSLGAFENGSFLYSDYNHLNDIGAELVFREILEPLMSFYISEDCE